MLEEILKGYLVYLPGSREGQMEFMADELPGIIIIPNGFSALRVEFLSW